MRANTFIRNFVVAATVTMLMAFTVMVASGYLFLLKCLNGNSSNGSQQIASSIPPTEAQGVITEIELSWTASEPLGNLTGIAGNGTGLSNNTSKAQDQGSWNETGNLGLENGLEILEQIENGNLENSNVGFAYFEPENGTMNASSHLPSMLEMQLNNVITEMVHNLSDTFNNTKFAKLERDRRRKAGWEEFKRVWGNSKTFVLISTGIVCIAGMVQFAVGAFLVQSTKIDIRTFHRRATKWMLINIGVCLVLTTCLSMTIALETDTEKNFGNPSFLSELERQHEKVSRIPGIPVWTVRLVAGIYSFILAADIVCLISAVFVSSFFMDRFVK